MSEKNPLAGFAEGSSKSDTKAVAIAGTAKTEEEAIAAGKKAFEENPDADACVIYDKKTGQFKQIAGKPMTPEQFTAVTAQMKTQLDAEGKLGFPPELGPSVIAELFERANKGESTEQIIKAMGDKLGLNQADLERARNLSQNKKSADSPKEGQVLDEAHKMTNYHTQAQMFAKEALRRYGHADGETRVQYWLEGATIALSWVLGINPERPSSFFREKLKVHPEWCCSNPDCGGECGTVRKIYEKDDPARLPRLGVEK